jgi:5-oxoprolinase (ATP-hydrolysing)
LASQSSGKDFKPKTVDEIAYGFIQVVNESMCRPIRALTQGKGMNAADHILASFGGAGAQHCFAIAISLGIEMVLIHRYSSILSAYGQALADVVFEVQEPAASSITKENMIGIQEVSNRLISEASEELKSQGFPEEHIRTELYLNLRYSGTGTAIMTMKPISNWDFTKIFIENYQKDFGFVLPDRDILVDDIRVRGIGKSIATGADVKWTTVHKELKTLKRLPASKPVRIESIYWRGLGRAKTAVYLLKNLKVGSEVLGPALIIDDTSTIAVEPQCSAVVTSEHVVGFLGSLAAKLKDAVITCDPILLSVFGHRFMSIAEQMGSTLQKTSISTNVKERLDFSCALFGPDGGLVANAPHIPVHLGSMQEAVRWQMENILLEKLNKATSLLQITQWRVEVTFLISP